MIGMPSEIGQRRAVRTFGGVLWIVGVAAFAGLTKAATPPHHQIGGGAQPPPPLGSMGFPAHARAAHKPTALPPNIAHLFASYGGQYQQLLAGYLAAGGPMMMPFESWLLLNGIKDPVEQACLLLLYQWSTRGAG